MKSARFRRAGERGKEVRGGIEEIGLGLTEERDEW
jgi:hypothetical protein